MPAAAPSLVGEVLDNRYRITRKLGEGGMGEVYAADHVHIEKKFAIKLLRQEILSNPEAISRFRQEARSSSSIGHRNIIAIEDFGTLNDGRIYMCMELLNGAALNDLITTPQPPDRLLNILIQTGHGLAAAHAKNIVHRDMKPENIFVTIGPNNEDVPKLLDFGIAKVAGNDGNNNLTKTGTIFGTPFYMAPEQALGNPVDARTDIYAVGVIMYEVFSGELPFKGESFMGILTQHITTNPQPVANIAAKNGRPLPNGLADVIMKCMSKDPNQRFSSMDELVNELVNIYRSIAGAGMSTYMEAFTGGAPGQPTSGRLPVPTPPMTGGYSPTPGVAPTMHVTPGAGMPMPMPPHHGSQLPVAQIVGVAPSGPHAIGAGGQLYDSGSSVLHVPKKSKAGLIIAIIALLAIGGGVAAFVIISGQEEAKPVATADAAVADQPDAAVVTNDKPDAAVVVTNDKPDAAVAGNDLKDADTRPEPDATVASNEPDAAVTPPQPDAAVVTPPDAAITVATVRVKIFLKSPAVPFEAYEGSTKLFDGPDAIEITPGTPRTITLKVKGYKPATVTITGKEPGGQFKTSLRPEPLDCSAVLVDARNNACKTQFCRSHPSDSKCAVTVVNPPALDCTAAIKEPRNKACVAQYCRLHKNEPRCDAE